MSQAYELLNSLADATPSLQLANPETEPHILISNDRVVTVPKELQRIAVQYDHDVETVTFDCPRYWDGLDMSELRVYVNYMRRDRVVGCYLARNVTVDTTDSAIMHFDWTISRNVSQVAGEIKFLVCIKKGDSEGNEVNHWNSELNNQMYVSEGLEVGDEFFDDYPDIILQWEEDVQRVKNELIAAGASGEYDGATFTPSVDDNGNLSWANDKGRENPATKNIKGPKGDTGPQGPKGDPGGTGATGPQGPKGTDGVSPTISSKTITGGHQITLTDADGTQIFTVWDGADGKNGYSPELIINDTRDEGEFVRLTFITKRENDDGTITSSSQVVDVPDGFSPKVTVTAITGGHRVAITDATGTKTFDVMDGTQDISEAVAAVIEEAKPFVVTIQITTSSGGGKTYTADKTYAEIKAAIDARKCCYAITTGLEMNILFPALVSSVGVLFTATQPDSSSSVVMAILSDSSIIVQTYSTQPLIEATGLLKGDGQGTISAAVAGTDYVTPDSMNTAIQSAIQNTWEASY